MNYNKLAVARSIDGADWDKNTPRKDLQYAIGSLLYTPANHPTIGRDICERRYPHLKTLCLCLEDAVADEQVAEAEEQLLDCFRGIWAALDGGTLAPEELPLLFLRPRSPVQLRDMYRRLGSCRELLAGFALPKFDSGSCDGYVEAVSDLNGNSASPVYALPILETRAVLGRDRVRELDRLRHCLDGVGGAVLNVRVGGNDLCNLLGVRRGIDQTIYENVLLADVMGDIVLAFGDGYVLTAPVWEYFGTAEQRPWREGLERELRRDRLNGFVGKTAIHPAQLEVIQRSLVVDWADYADAREIRDWSAQGAVAKGVGSARMNEERVHRRWADRVLALAKIYGVKEREYAAGNE